MEKLIELLSKAKPLSPWFWRDVRDNGAMIISKEEKNNWHSWEICFVKKEELCWKEYWFIKRLIDNDKIDFSRGWEYCEKSIEEFDWLRRTDEDWLIMILAIQDKPIEFLINVLK